MTVLPFGEWLPDAPDFDNPGSATIQNVVPLTQASYGPMPTPTVYSGALTARCQGSYSFVDATAAPHIFAGDATKLYQLTAGSAPAFSDISRVVAVPAVPVLSAVVSGALAGATYFVKITYTNAQGETTVSAEASLAVAANSVLKVASPIASTGATGWNVYVSTASGTETRQNGGTPIAIGTDWQEPNTGLVAGAAMPSANTADIPYTTGSPIDPLTPSVPFWSMTSFGERIVATNYTDDPQTFLVGTDAHFSALAAAAPKARFAATILDFLFLGNTNDAVSGAAPRRLWWSAIGNPQSWPTPGTNAAIQVQSDYQDCQQSDLGQMTGLVGGHLASADGAAFFERGIYRILYVGSSSGIFSIKVAEGAAGTSSPLSIVPCRALGRTAVVAYLGEDGFKIFDGQSATSIGFGKIDRTFFNDLDPAYLSSVQGVADPRLPLLYWLANSSSGAGNGLYDKLYIYNTILGRWARCDLAAIPAEWLTRAMTIGKTLDALDAFGTLDSLPAPLSSGYWAGNSPRLALFDSAHKLNFMTGTAMAPTVETSEGQPTTGRRSKILSARPLVDGGANSVAISIGVRDRLTDSVVYQAAVPMNIIGECPQRITGRYGRAKLTMNAAETWTHLQGVEIDYRAEGKR